MNGSPNALEPLPDPAGGKLLRLLAIECTEKNGSVALLTASGNFFLSLSPQQSTARSLAPAVKELLAAANLSVKELERICVTCGPGSFTGLRIGIGLARAMSFGADVPLSGISSLATLAWDYAFAREPRQQQKSPRFVTVLNAYRNELFVAAWSHDDNQKLARMTDDSIISRPELASWARQSCDSRDVLVVSPESAAFFGDVNSSRLAPTAWGVVNAALMEDSLDSCELDLVLPRYLRRSAAEEKRDVVSNTAARS